MTTPKILLVDDVKVFLEFERPFFERAGCEVLTAATGPEALRIVRDENPHIVLLDYEMPGMNGDEVCRRIKADPERSHIPVLLVTSHRSDAVIEKCRRAGCTDVLVKPVAGKDLLEKVVRILQIPYRVHLRTRVTMEVSLGVSGDSIAVLGYSENISEGGMLIETLEPPDPEAKVLVSFTLPSPEQVIRTNAEVIRVTGPHPGALFGVALRFAEKDTSALAAIRAFVMQEVTR